MSMRTYLCVHTHMRVSFEEYVCVVVVCACVFLRVLGEPIFGSHSHTTCTFVCENVLYARIVSCIKVCTCFLCMQILVEDVAN
jgi:hypothetical protein